MLVLILVNVWQFAGMTMIIYLAGLQSIPGELLEAATIDGATPWQRFTRVTLPLLMPAIRINVVTNIIGSLSVFDIIMSLTEGGPGYSTESLSHLHHAHVLRQPDGLLHGCGADTVLHHTRAGAHIHAPNAGKGIGRE